MGIFSKFKKTDVIVDVPPPAPKPVAPLAPHHTIELKIKGMSLAAEARIIRRWEKRLWKAARHHESAKSQAHRLWLHRTSDVATEARATYLAYGFLKGLPYSVMEPKRYSDPDWNSIQRMVLKYGIGRQQDLSQHLEQWKQEAGETAVRGPRKPRIRPSNRPKE